MYGHSRNSLEFIRVQLMVAAMESLLTVEQSKRILLAAEWGGFDAGMTSLARVSDQIAKERSEAGIAAARLEGKIISLQSRLESVADRAPLEATEDDEPPYKHAMRNAGNDLAFFRGVFEPHKVPRRPLVSSESEE